jgi:hypothetical protein
MSQANVRSVDAIRDFKVTLVNFAEDARVALSAMEMEIRQVRNWLERDQMTYWKAQVKRSNEEIAEARAELHRRQITQMNSDAVSDADQKEALRKAQRRLRMSEEMVERVKKWVPVLEHALAEYHSQAQPLGDRLSGGLINSLAVLDRMVAALDQYLATEAPAAPVLPPAATGTSAESAPGSARAAAAGEASVPPDEPADATAPADAPAEVEEAAPESIEANQEARP